jgi:hypothetical protein
MTSDAPLKASRPKILVPLFNKGTDLNRLKIEIAVKKDCQVTISPLLQHMLGFKRAIFPQGDHVADWVADLFCQDKMLYQLCGYCISASPISHDPSKSIIWGSLVVK